MSISITQDIRSITDLKQHAGDILEQIQTTKRPVVLTVNGKARVVLVDAREYEKTTAALELARELIPAEEDIRAGRTRPAGEFFQEFKRAKKI